jgi:hypothetical protein
MLFRSSICRASVRRFTTAVSNVLTPVPKWSSDKADSFPKTLINDTIVKLKKERDDNEKKYNAKRFEERKAELRKTVLIAIEDYITYSWHSNKPLRVMFPSYTEQPEAVFIIVSELRQPCHGFKRVDIEFQNQPQKTGLVIVIYFA